MAPIKFEDNIREKLQNREIEPSADVWGKLDQALGKPAKKRVAPATWWAIAASLMVLFFLGRTFLSDTEPQLQLADEVIENIQTDPSVEADSPVLEGDVQFATSQVESKETVNDPVVNTKEPIASQKMMVQDANPVSNDQITKAAVAVQNEEIKEADYPLEDRSEETFVTGKVDEVVAQVQALQQLNNEVTPQEVEALLLSAQREIANRKLLEDNAGKVDPMALLMDVESEMERSFRDKVFEALGDSYNKVRTAVAERNN